MNQEYKLTTADLEGLGILSNSMDQVLLKKYEWLTEEESALMIAVFLAGEKGLHKRELAKHVKKDEHVAVRLEAVSLINWERDLNGRKMFLTATWKGSELGELLVKKARSINHKTVRSHA